MILIHSFTYISFHSILFSFFAIFRRKRQLTQGFPAFSNPGFQNPYGGSQSTANANSNSFGYGPNGFGAANALAQAQGSFCF